MKERLSRGVRLVLATVLFGMAGVIATAAPASANSCTNCVTATVHGGGGYIAGQNVEYGFELKNPLTTLAQNITLNITLPAEMLEPLGDGGSFWPDNGTYKFNATTRTITVQPISSSGVVGALNPRDSWWMSFQSKVKEGVTAPEFRVKSTITWSNASGVAQTPNVLKDRVWIPSKPYNIESTTTFSPSLVVAGSTSVLTSTFTNTGTGNARSFYYYIHIDDRLIVDKSTIPAGCSYSPQFTYTSWDGQKIVEPQKLDCTLRGALGPGQSVTKSVTVTTPATAGAAKYEANFELSCASPDDFSHNATISSDSVGLLLVDPPIPPELYVVQMGGPAPITLPEADSEPMQPTAGGQHAVVAYAYNVGGSDISSNVTVVVTIPEGFTPKAITASTDDSAASAPVCNLATRTCVFSRLGVGKRGVVIIDGELSPAIPDKSKLTVSSQASAATIASATDTTDFGVAAVANVNLSLVATSAYVSGSPVAFTLTAKNLGPSNLQSPIVKVTLPEGGTFVSVPNGCTANGVTMTCKWTKLEAEGIDGEEFTAKFGSAPKASATAELSTSTPLTGDSVSKDSVSVDVAPAEVAAAIATAIAASTAKPTALPATGSQSYLPTVFALMLLACGAMTVVLTRRRRVL